MCRGDPLADEQEGQDRPQDAATRPNPPTHCSPLIPTQGREAQASASVRFHPTEHGQLATPNILWLARVESPSNCVFFACHPYAPAVLTFSGPRLAYHAFRIARAARLQIVRRQNAS